METFGDLDILSIVGRFQLNWTGLVNRMDSKRKLSDVFNNNSQGSRLKQTAKNRWWNCVQTDINKFKIKNWKESYKNSADW
jgi:hypothetical protein